MKNWTILIIISSFICCQSSKQNNKKLIQLGSGFTMEVESEFKHDVKNCMESDIGVVGCYTNENRKKEIFFEIYKRRNGSNISKTEFINNSNQFLSRIKKRHPKLKGDVFFLENINASSCVIYQLKIGDIELNGLEANIQIGNSEINILYESTSDKKSKVENDFTKLIHSIKPI